MPSYRSSSSDRGGSRGGSRGPRDYRDRDRAPHVSPEALEQARGLIEYLARSLVDDTERVQVRQVSQGSGGVVFELSVAPDDMGRVIGKQGRVANAIRTLLKSASTRMGARITLEIA